MTKVRRIWKNMSFWNKIERIFGLVGGVTVADLGYNGADPKWFIIIGIVGVLAKILHILIEDVDNNGIVDLFQNESEQ